RVFGAFDSFQSTGNIAFLSTSEAQYTWPLQLVRNPAHGFEVAFGRSRKTGLDHVDAEFFQLAADDHFLLDGHAGAGRLLAVAERRIEYLPNIVSVGRSHFQISSKLPAGPRQKQKLPRRGQREFVLVFYLSPEFTARSSPPPVSSPAGALTPLSTIITGRIT